MQKPSKLQESYFEICDHDKENPYVMISREMIQDSSISPEVKGVIFYILSLPKNMNLTFSFLQKELGVEKVCINSALQLGKKFGYLFEVTE